MVEQSTKITFNREELHLYSENKLIEIINYLFARIGSNDFRYRNDKKKWQKQLKELVIVNTRLSKENKEFKKIEAQKLSFGFASIANNE